MWNWLLEHWWVATIVPYMAFNVFIVWQYYHEEGPFDLRDPATLTIHVLFLCAGVWIFVFFFITTVAQRLFDWVCALPKVRSVGWPRVRRWFARTVLWFMFFMLGVVIYALSLMSTGHEPSAFERWAMIMLISIGAAFGVDWINQEFRKP